MHQSFPSVSGQPYILLQTFGWALAIDAVVSSHQLKWQTPFNVPSGHSSFVAAILQRAPFNVPFGHSPFVAATPQHVPSSCVFSSLSASNRTRRHVSSNIAVEHHLLDDNCTHTPGGTSMPMPRTPVAYDGLD